MRKTILTLGFCLAIPAMAIGLNGYIDSTVADLSATTTAPPAFFRSGSVVPQPVVNVAIDIRPGSCPNPFNAKSKGLIPVAIVGSADFDVTQVDLASLGLEGVPIVEGHIEFEDVTEPGDNADCDTCFEAPRKYSGDGFLDLIVKFDAQELAAAIGDRDRDECVVLTLIGNMLNGTSVAGSDRVVMK